MNRRGGLLLEAVVAIAIFVSSGLVILSVMRDATGRMQRLLLDRKALDLSASAAALIECGASTAERLNGAVPEWSSGWLSGSAGQGGRSDFADDLPVPSGWRIRAAVRGGPNDGVRLVEITTEYSPGGDARAGRDGESVVASGVSSRVVRRESGEAETTVGELDEIELEAMRGAGRGGSRGAGQGGGRRP